MEFELEDIHLTVLLITAIAIIMADHDGFQYFLGKKQTLDSTRVKRLHYTVLAGLVLMIITGGYLLTEKWGEVVGKPAFYLKMFMVGALVANSFVIGSLMTIATQKSFSELTWNERHKLLASGGVSVVCWIGSALIGLLYL